MHFLGNDPTGSYQGRFQRGSRRWHKRRNAVARAQAKELRRAARKAAAEYIRADSKPAGKIVHPAYVQNMPDRAAHLRAQASNNFWSRVRPKMAASPAP